MEVSIGIRNVQQLFQEPLMASELEQIGEELGVKIQAQHQEIFEMMHRI